MSNRAKLQLNRHYCNGHDFLIMLIHLYETRFWGWNAKFNGFNVQGRIVLLDWDEWE
jgi:hypothetical protein